jgi:hypothetical protein
MTEKPDVGDMFVVHHVPPGGRWWGYDVEVRLGDVLLFVGREPRGTLLFLTGTGRLMPWGSVQFQEGLRFVQGVR